MNPEDMDWRELFLRRLFALLLLGLAMLVPFVLLDSYVAGFAAFMIGGAYMIVRGWLNGRGKPKGKRSPGRVGWFLVLNNLSGTAAGMGLAGLIMVGWMRWAYTDTGYGEYAALLATLREWSIDWPVTLLLASVALSGFSLLFVKRPADGAPDVGQRLRNYGLAILHGTWMDSFAGVALLLAGLQFAGLPIATEILLEQMAIGRDREFADLLLTFPVVPLSVFIAATLFVSFSIDLSDGTEAEFLVMGCAAGKEANSPGLGTRRRVATAMNVWGYFAALTLAIYTLHSVILLAIGSGQTLLPAAKIGGDLDGWVVEQISEARLESDIAASINKAGYWSPREPGAGVTELVAGLGESLEDLGLDGSCRVTIKAAEIDGAEQELIESLVNGGSRLAEAYRRFGTTERPGNMTVKYCVKVTCPVPTAWDAPTALSLWSSHPSGNRNWMYWLYFDLYAAGRATAGGYCNADGTLADSYQG